MEFPTQKVFLRLIKTADCEDDAHRDISRLMKTLVYIANKGRIKGLIRTRKTAVQSWGWKLVANDPKFESDTQSATTRLAQAIETVIDTIYEKALYGKFAIRIDYQNTKKGDLTIERQPIAYRLRQHEFDITNTGQLMLLPDKKLIEPLDPNYIFAGDGPECRGGDMLAVGELEILRRIIRIEWINYSKKLKGLIQGIDRGASDDEYAAAEKALENAIKENFMLASDLIDFKFHQLTATGGADNFEKLSTELKNEIAVAIVGQANTSELPKSGGSRAAVEVQQLVSADIMYADIVLANRIINTQLLVVDRKLTYGNTNLPYSFTINTDESPDYESHSRIAIDTYLAGADVCAVDLYDNSGLVRPTGIPDVLTAPQKLA